MPSWDVHLHQHQLSPESGIPMPVWECRRPAYHSFHFCRETRASMGMPLTSEISCDQSTGNPCRYGYAIPLATGGKLSKGEPMPYRYAYMSDK